MESESRLQELRKTLSSWESSFKEKYGRKPTKPEIKEDSKTHSLYLEYFNLKRATEKTNAPKSFSSAEPPEIAKSMQPPGNSNQVEGVPAAKVSISRMKLLTNVKLEHIELWKEQRAKSRLKRESHNFSPSQSVCLRPGSECASIVESPAATPYRPKSTGDSMSPLHNTDISSSAQTTFFGQITDSSKLMISDVYDNNELRRKQEENERRDCAAASTTANAEGVRGQPDPCNLSRITNVPKRGLIFRGKSKVSSHGPPPSSDTIDLMCHEVLTPFDTSTMILSPGDRKRIRDVEFAELEPNSTRKHLFTDLNKVLAACDKDIDMIPSIKGRNTDYDANDNGLRLQQSVSYSKPKVHPLEKLSASASTSGPPVRENFVRLQVTMECCGFEILLSEAHLSWSRLDESE